MFINYNLFNSFTDLFTDFIEQYDKVAPFYYNDFRNKENYEVVFKNVSESFSKRNINLYDLIKNQYNFAKQEFLEEFEVSETTLKNIELLKEPNTLVIATGQQVGIIGGPLYTLYKTITTIKLAEQLKDEFPAYNFVPVFWLEAEDHDFEEINSIKIFDGSNSLKKISFTDSASFNSENKSVGDLLIDEQINAFFDTLQNSLRKTEFTDDMLLMLKSFYRTEYSFKHSFKLLLTELFDKYGLVIFDPSDKEVKKHLVPVFYQELTNYLDHSEQLIEVSADLEDRYHAQVKVRPINLFYKYQSGRYLIEPSDKGFSLKNKRIRFSKEELFNQLKEEPELFSPNVVLRPICQDYIFPTAFYVGGPSEIAYFAQIFSLYDFFNLERPILFPRSSVTLVENSMISLLQKYNLSMKDVLVERDRIAERIINNVSSINIEKLFNTTKNEIQISLNTLTNNIIELDKNVEQIHDKISQKIINSLDEYKNKSLELQKRRYEIAINQSNKLINMLIPDKNMQEREINFTYFVNKYGYSVIYSLYDKININSFSHQVIDL